ncbi:MAG TPA: type II secretion system protein GspM, partial [Rubrivivax sp.]|nr:type II secretion system protein GspM [Rubrivivax sp.]
MSEGIETERGEAAPGPRHAAHAARAWWRSLAVREKRLFLAGAAVLGLYLTWAVAVQPAWRTIARAAAERDALEAQWQTMQGLAEEARQLRSAPRVSQPQAVAALEAATARPGAWRCRATAPCSRSTAWAPGPCATGSPRHARARGRGRWRPISRAPPRATAA